MADDVVTQLRELRTDIARTEAEIRSREAARDRAQEQIKKLLEEATEVSGTILLESSDLDLVISDLEASAEELTTKLSDGLAAVRAQIDANPT